MSNFEDYRNSFSATYEDRRPSSLEHKTNVKKERKERAREEETKKKKKKKNRKKNKNEPRDRDKGRKRKKSIDDSVGRTTAVAAG